MIIIIIIIIIIISSSSSSSIHSALVMGDTSANASAIDQNHKKREV